MGATVPLAGSFPAQSSFIAMPGAATTYTTPAAAFPAATSAVMPQVTEFAAAPPAFAPAAEVVQTYPGGASVIQPEPVLATDVVPVAPTVSLATTSSSQKLSKKSSKKSSKKKLSSKKKEKGCC